MPTIKVIVFFLLTNGGSVQVERDVREHHLDDELCEILAVDVFNELAGAVPPRIDMNTVVRIRYNCIWLV